MKNGKQCLFCRRRVELRRRLRLISTVRATCRRNAHFKQLTTGVLRACHCAQGTLKRAAGARSWAWFDLPSQMELWICLSRASSFPATPSSSPCPHSLPLSSRLEHLPAGGIPPSALPPFWELCVYREKEWQGGDLGTTPQAQLMGALWDWAGCLSNFAPLVPSSEPGSIHIYSVNSENLYLKDGLDLSCQRVVWKSSLEWRKAEPRFAACEEPTSSSPVHLEHLSSWSPAASIRTHVLKPCRDSLSPGALPSAF